MYVTMYIYIYIFIYLFIYNICIRNVEYFILFLIITGLLM